MDSASILTHVDELGRATLTMNRPQLSNAFDDTLVATMAAELRRLEADDQVRVVFLAGSGKNFCAGADLSWMRRMAHYNDEENLADAGALAQLFRLLNELRKPTIALVQGVAYGGGVGLVACCDIAVCSARATFCLSETKLGIIPALISPYVVPAIGSRAARRYFQSAEVFDAVEAHRLGLVHVMVQEDVTSEAERISLSLLKAGPRAMSAAKEQVARVVRGPIDAALLQETVVRIAELRASAEGKEGLGAFLEKRNPNWVKG